MGRILAIDYGKRRCGLAVTDPLRLSVNPLPFVPPAELLSAVSEFVADGELDMVLLTRSAHRDGTPNDVQAAIAGFAERLQKKHPTLPVEYQDEFGSSREAMHHLRAAGVGRKARARKGALDSVSAGIILERYLRDSGIW